MSNLESWLTRIWYGEPKPPLALRAIERLYSVASKCQPAISTESLPVPVIVVGNFTVGGTGKTPLIIALVNELNALGYKPGVISRGYGRESNAAQSVTSGSPIRVSGDEPLLIAKRTGAPVRVDAKRHRAAVFLIKHGCNVIISDDGLQHRALPRQIEIEVFDNVRRYGNGRLLPAGPLREAVRRVDMRVGNGLSSDTDDAYAMQLQMTQCYHLESGEKKSLSEFQGQAIQAVAGIGNPQRFFDALTALGLDVQAHPFPDHHQFSESDLPESGPVFMTEKDAVKFAKTQRADIWVVPVDARLSDAFLTALNNLITLTLPKP